MQQSSSLPASASRNSPSPLAFPSPVHPPHTWTPPVFRNTTVFLPGLSPDTNAEWLHQYGTGHGRVTDVRIVPLGGAFDPVAGLIRFATEGQAKECINHARQNLGLAADFGKLNVRTEMQMAADPTSTNLYLSNLPPTWDEKTLVQELFADLDCEVKSCRILRANDRSGIIVPEGMKGPSRGVGFARLATREQCELAIERLHRMQLPNGDGALPLQVRFADSGAQKGLKAAMSAQTFPTQEGESQSHPVIKAPLQPVYAAPPVTAAPLMQASSWPGAVNPTMLFLQQQSQQQQFGGPGVLPPAIMAPRGNVPHSAVYAPLPVAYAPPTATSGFLPLPLPPDSPVFVSHGPPSPVTPMIFRMSSMEDMMSRAPLGWQR